MAAEHLPSPLSAAPERYARLLPPRPEQLKAAAAEEGGAVLASSLDAVEGAVRRCDTEADAPLVLYVSKMVAVPAAALPRWAGVVCMGFKHALNACRGRMVGRSLSRPACLAWKQHPNRLPQWPAHRLNLLSTGCQASRAPPTPLRSGSWLLAACFRA